MSLRSTLLLLAASWIGALPARAAQEDELVSLHALHDDPAAWLGRTVRVVFQVHSAPQVWNPYLTRYGSGDWFALRVWSDEQALWNADEFEHPLAFLFVRRGTPTERVLAQARTYQRFEARVRVAQVFLGRPWVEVESAARLPVEVSEGAILHASRALQLLEGKEWALARDDLTRALTPAPPPRARRQLERLVERCDRRLAARERRGANLTLR